MGLSADLHHLSRMKLEQKEEKEKEEKEEEEREGKERDECLHLTC